MRLPPLNAIRAFEVASRHLSFKKAAEELFVTPAAISYQIKLLEEHLGMTLFERHNRQVVLTKEARQALPLLSLGFEQIEKGIGLLEQVSSPNFVVSTGPAFAIKWLAPRLHEFSALYPDVNASILASLHITNFRVEPVDAAVRFGRFDDTHLFAEKLVDEFVVPLCHPGWLAAQGGLRQPADIFDHPLIHDDSIFFDPSAPSWESYAQQQGITGVDTHSGVRFNQADHALQAAMDGAGIVLSRSLLAEPDVRAGRLVKLFPETAMDTGMARYYACPREKADRRENQVFLAWLKSLLADY